MNKIGNYNVIADTGASLLKLLREHMVPEPVGQPEFIGLASPADKGDLQLSLFLYSIQENSEARSSQMISVGSSGLQYPPMSVELHYLLTAHSSAELQNRAVDEHRILGKAMQVLYDHSVLRGPHLLGTLAENNEEVRISPAKLSVDSLRNLWNFSDIPYKLSIAYSVGPVNIDSTRIKPTKRVLEREIRMTERGG